MLDLKKVERKCRHEDVIETQPRVNVSLSFSYNSQRTTKGYSNLKLTISDNFEELSEFNFRKHKVGPTNLEETLPMSVWTPKS